MKNRAKIVQCELGVRQICEQHLREIGFFVHRKSLRSLSSAHEKWGQKQKCNNFNNNFVQYIYIYIYIYYYKYTSVYIYIYIYNL